MPDCKQQAEKIKKEISKVIVGLNDVVDKMLISMFTGSHVLLVGVPGLAKTMLSESFARASGMEFKRVQFTPDLMPSDITGAEVMDTDSKTQARSFRFVRGPVFTNILLADEINRTPPKTQSALLEAMQEKSVHSAGVLHKLPSPFMVIATQNPLEQEGTYALPEAQLDRFIFSVDLSYPVFEEEKAILTGSYKRTPLDIKPVINAEEIMTISDYCSETAVSEKIVEYILKIVRATRPSPDNPVDEVKKYVQWGAGPRAGDFLLKAAKVKAVLEGKLTPDKEDVDSLLYSVLNHRVILNFTAKVDEFKVEDLIRAIRGKVKL